MKTIDAVKAYKALQSATLTGVDYPDNMKILKAMRAFRPIAENYDKDLEEGRKAFQDSSFEEMREKAMQHTKAVQSGSKDGFLPAEEIAELNRYFGAYEMSCNALNRELDEKEVSVNTEPISEEAFGKFSASNNFKGEDLLLLSDVFSVFPKE